MKSNLTIQALFAVAVLAAIASSVPAVAKDSGEEHYVIPRQIWSFGGFRGQYDKAQLQRGFQVYQVVCSQCHGLSRVKFRNLAEPGGPEFPEDAVKALAAKWPNQITDGPNDEGKMFERPALPSDPILGPYKNDKEARAAQNGSLPPNLSLIAKARNTHHEVSWPMHVVLMAKDIVAGYQEGGPDFLHALLTGYKDPPEGFKLVDGMSYNVAFPGNQIAMPSMLAEGAVAYQDGTPPTVDNYARDVSAFLAWAADPSHDHRKRMGWQVMLYLLVTTGLLYLGKKRIWAKAH